MWNKININTDKGELKVGIAPIIISASRSTDIPAFHAKWFFNRLERGYVTWINPFNRKTPSYISFANTRVVVFWTKNPKPIIQYLPELDKRNINYYFQYTVNDYDKEGFEPNVPNLEKRIQTFIDLSEKIGKEKVIWRFDPLILTDNLTKVWYLGNKLIHYTNKLVFSYADIMEYKRVQNNLIREIDFFTKNNIEQAEFTKEKKIEFAEGMQKILIEWKKINPDFTIATCGEDIHLEKYDIEHNKCIDDDLMIKLFSHDKKLMDFLGYTPPDNTLFGVQTRPNLKDKGQRLACGCIFSKDIGSYNTCNNLCVYCYANTSRKVVEKNLKLLSPDSESILPNEIEEKKADNNV
jgi:DNA repair photolyase